jgi:UDP-glucuronate 4-epimerase
MSKILITGVAGFIGYHVAHRLLGDGHDVSGFDNMSDYYDVRLKQARLRELKSRYGFTTRVGDLADGGLLKSIIAGEKPEIVIHLAAQAGVRYSLSNPESYVASNLVGHANLLEACRSTPPRHLLYASSSSVYGANRDLPFRESDKADRPVSLYAATKRANEGMSYSYSHLFGLAATGLRFFTVYGEWGRPDMAPILFAKAIMEGKPIDLFNNGNVARDFTYAGDVVEAVVRLIDCVPEAGEGEAARHRVVNIASGRKVVLADFIAALEEGLGKQADRRNAPMQPGDVKETWADTSLLKQLTGYAPQTSLAEGVGRFARWYKDYHAHG